MSIFPSAPEPKSKLGYYRLLSPSASVRVSPLCLGAMNIGDNWAAFMGTMDKPSAFKLLDAFYENGGNFIDTACNYQDGQSESRIGEWMAQKNNRDEMVIATKYSTAYFTLDRTKINANKAGNSRKNMVNTVDACLKRLQTTYIDVLYIHWWDYTTSIEELMQSLNHLVASGKVLYLGVSDTPAWVVTKANQYARDHGLAQFCVYQGEWSIAKRDFEREILPMCKHENMGLAIWGSLGGGRFKTEEQIKEQEKSGDKGRALYHGPITDTEKAVIKVLDKLAKAKGTTITGIALSYVMQKAPFVFPIIGGRKVDHLEENIDALKVALTKEDIKELEDASPVSLGFPHSFVGSKLGQNNLVNMVAKYDWVEDAQPIVPKTK